MSIKWIHETAGGTVLNTYHSIVDKKVYGYTHIIHPNEWVYSGNFIANLDATDTLKCVVSSSSSHMQVLSGSYIGVTMSAGGVKTHNMLMSGRGELNQWEFFKGFVTMFILIISQDKDNPTNFIIETYYDTFIKNSASVQLDWTEKVDVSEIKLNPLELSRKLKFRYEEDEGDYSLGVYAAASNPVGYLYGTKALDFTAYTELTDEEELIATPFAPTIVKALDESVDATFIISDIYSGNEDGSEFEPFENLPRILYNNGVKQTQNIEYTSPVQNHATSRFLNEGEYLQFSHLSDTTTGSTTAADYNFGECPLFSNLPQVSENLYNMYWSPYYDEMYHKDTRIMTLKVNLNASDIVNFEFFHTVFIKNRIYRVNRIDYKPHELSTVEFILLSPHTPT